MTISDEARVTEVPFEDELGGSFGRYAQKVILDRAIPDIRDGLKPVQRRIVYAMHEGGNTHDKPYRKSAKTVGDVMGNYHPHGDSSIYEALVRLAQPWKMRYPLVDGHGNFGSMDDDPAAAMRYTEARLSPIAAELLRDIEKDTVPWRPNFDEKAMEPVVLPAGFLNLLVNGASGVSAGFATEIPSHNLGETVDAALALMADPDISLDALMRHVPGPDFPTGGILMGAEGLREAYETGRGKVVLRARHHVEQQGGKTLIVFTEIPYNIVKSDLVRQMDALRLEREVQGVHDVRDETDREGLRLVVELARSADVDGVLAYLFKKTNLQINYNFNMVMIARNTPVQQGLRGILEAFVDHRRRVVRRRSQHDLDKAAKRVHEVEGLIKAIDILDEVIATIRRSKDRADARQNLVALDFTEAQADAILDLRLVRLTNLELLQLTQEAASLHDLIAGLEKILGDPAECDRVVGDELQAIKAKHGDDRRTTLEDQVERLDIDVAVHVKDQEVVVGVTRQGWIKWSSIASFAATGATRKASGVRPGDRMHMLVNTRTTRTVLVFSNTGQCYPIPVHQIPEAKWGEVGSALINVCGMTREEQLVDVIEAGDFPDDRYLLFVTRQGAVKATALSEFASSRSSGILAIKLSEGDSLARVAETDLTGDMMMLTHLGQGIRFDLGEIAVQGRAAKGVIGMRVGRGDYMQDVLFTPSDADDLQVAVFTRAGRAKLTPLEQYPRQRRGGKGVRMIISRVSNQHECVALSATRGDDGFEVVDDHGHEHLLDARRIPVTRRDGNAWTVVDLKGGALVSIVEQLPAPETD
ncbi:MAG: DNA topoisomerase 4 subunit A [Deltaproteobacteria bacterium]|nr:MAG: DNA topoisomerase 4 subunit A [Deltaproteobacteria bacterium]